MTPRQFSSVAIGLDDLPLPVFHTDGELYIEDNLLFVQEENNTFIYNFDKVRSLRYTILEIDNK